MKNDNKSIKNIISNEFNVLVNKISLDFVRNYNLKTHNWILKGFDDTLIANMVFVSSFESKYGNMFENIAMEIAKLKFGAENVPFVFQGVGVSDEEYNTFKSSYHGDSQIILTKIDQSASQETIIRFREDHIAKGRGRKRIPCSLNKNALNKIHALDFQTTELTNKPIDLGIYDDENKEYVIFEIKAGGNLDSAKAPGDVAKMLTAYASLGKINSSLYFATLYHKNGEGNVWTGSIKKYLSEDLILVGSAFWEFILKDTSFVEFKEIYYEVVEELKISNRINCLIENVN